MKSLVLYLKGGLPTLHYQDVKVKSLLCQLLDLYHMFLPYNIKGLNEFELKVKRNVESKYLLIFLYFFNPHSHCILHNSKTTHNSTVFTLV